MSSRLAQRDGEWIDRTRPISFTFEGKPITGFAGDTISSALCAAGVRLLGRSFKYHRPRGVMSLANHDVNVLVQDTEAARGQRRTNLRADVTPISEGMCLEAVNTRGGLRRDRLRYTQAAAKLMPVGFYYKDFYKPRWAFPMFERAFRRVAGLGRIDLDRAAGETPKRYDWCEVLVVGAGPAGLAAAVAAAEAGARTLLVDEQPHAGGSLGYQRCDDPDAQQHRDELFAALRQHENLELRTGVVAQGCYGDLWIALTDGRRLTKLRARAMVCATGVYEQPAVFGNNDLPGVMLATAAQRLVHHFSVRPCHRAVLVTANTDGYRAAACLADAGVEVAAIVDLRTGDKAATSVPPPAGVEVLKGWAVTEAHYRDKRQGVSGVTVARLGADGAYVDTGRQRTLDCDAVMMSVGWAPAGGLLYQAGTRFVYDAGVEQFVPGALPDGVFAAGRVNGVFELADQRADGVRAGRAAAAHVGRSVTAIDSVARSATAQSHPYPVFTGVKAKAFVDLDEDIDYKDIVHAHQEGYDNIELMKRYTTVGMGASQGKLSNMNAVRILARLNGDAIEHTGTTTSRPFVHPVSFEQLAGRRFHAMRHTPMHGWHKAQGAQFLWAGTWLRPAHYGPSDPARAAKVILDEARHVRKAVGMVDVGTLGKLQIEGPDAAAFIERIYTGRFTAQKVGRLRYALACDETGVVIDDGIVARLDDDRFYVTATSSGAAAMYREMQRWAIVWGMDITLINATGHLTAMNIAGPVAREVLAPLTDIDISPDAMPYLAAREGRVAGAPAKLLRVGFVGELGYEVHVPAGAGLAVWRAIMDAGKPRGIRPFGIEAQRLLRLEKGHLIVGQDTDALTTPIEADLQWAVAMDKPFFVGRRSLELIARQPAKRTLVGFDFAPEYDGPLPKENHLIMRDGDIVGRVTSIAPQSTLDHAVGLAHVRPDMAEPGTRLAIKVDGGQVVEAKVARLPFFDAGGERQKH